MVGIRSKGPLPEVYVLTVGKEQDEEFRILRSQRESWVVVVGMCDDGGEEK
jgi:hypothetical protein